MLITAPAFAQVEARSQELSAYAGELFGDKLTDTAVSGQVPELDDDVTYGIRYAYNLTPNFALEASVGETLTSVTKLAGGWLGAEYGSRRFANPLVRRLLAVVLAAAGGKMFLV